MMVHKPSAVLIHGGIGLAGFGVACDGGVFGPMDGHDHSAMFVVAASSSVGPTFAVVNNITGDEVVALLPSRKPPQQQT
jgi:hypothetical protein